MRRRSCHTVSSQAAGGRRRSSAIHANMTFAEFSAQSHFVLAQIIPPLYILGSQSSNTLHPRPTPRQATGRPMLLSELLARSDDFERGGQAFRSWCHDSVEQSLGYLFA
jgi:hypothetical protein